LSTKNLREKVLEKLIDPTDFENLYDYFEGEYDSEEIIHVLTLAIKEKTVGLSIVVYPWGVEFLYRKK